MTAAAAISPALIPELLADPSGIAASEFARAASSVAALAGKVAFSTVCAAATAAASADASAGA